MVRLRLGPVGAILLALAAWTAQLQPTTAGCGCADAAREMALAAPASPLDAATSIAADPWDDTDDDLTELPEPPSLAPPPRSGRPITAGTDDAPSARLRPRSTGPPVPAT